MSVIGGQICKVQGGELLRRLEDEDTAVHGLIKFAFVKPGLLEDVKSRKLAHDERELPVSLEGQAHDCEREPDRVAGQPRGGR